MTSEKLPFLPFALPDIGEEEIAEVVDTLRSGWVTTGPKTKRFEEDFTAFLGNPSLQSLAVNSATAGLHLALEALGIGPGDEVITTTHTFTATAEVVRYLGADVVLVDIDPATLCIDPKAVEAAITPRTKAILPVHYGGLSCDMPALLAIAKKHGLKVVEDAAHALPTTCGGKLIGTLESDVTVFSFYANKTITTGEGGMVVTRHAELANRMKVMRLHGMSRDAFDRFTAKVPSWYYEIVAPGFKYNLTDIAAALGLQQLKRARAFQQKRETLAQQFNAALADLPLITPPLPAQGDLHAWHLYVVRLADDVALHRDRFIELLYEAGIGCSVHYIPLHLQPYWRDRYGLTPNAFPHSQKAFERMVSLPLYTRMTEADVDRVVQAVRRALG
ncbi:DegT/DnrJ/EryC1/StrS aminotransferase family protein [Piscinibacter sp. HJYY11]|uniref:DegT/DnrJ/EryC1/StrS family aminotransferase n=1 Tax=Piscinibacter sp. HJYY11 TaxID=2801333 RepID=UPI00191E5D89|nr:DegT/DnrJ/EryC1/StrS family aminotransferase [Piscinibacter sp. HJYY11]MBL0727938.1 DegT/DnrJ/EryC1/StrS family aminotransferase [Piscinibacter sp. HJYY11]